MKEPRGRESLTSEQETTELSFDDKLKKFGINKRAAMIIIFLCVFVDVLGYSMILPLLPIVATQTFGASSFLVGVMIASNALATFTFAPLWGKLSDRVGRKGPLILSQVGTLASFLILGLSNSIANIFFSRILDGMFGGQVPIIRAFVTDITDEKDRSTQMGRFTAGMASGIILGPSIGGLLGELNWRFPAFIATGLSVFAILFTLKFLMESMPRERRLAIKERKSLNQKKRKIFSYMTALVILRLAEIVSFAIAFNMVFSSFALVLNLRYGLTIGMIGIFSTFAGLNMIIFGGVLIKPLTKKFGEKKLLFFTLGVAFMVFMSFPFLNEAWTLFVFVIPFMFMQIILRTIIFTNLSKGVEEDEQGVVSGWAANMFSIAQIIAPLIGYWFLDIQQVAILGITLNAYFLIGISCTIAVLILLILIIFDLKNHPEHFLQAELKRVNLGD